MKSMLLMKFYDLFTVNISAVEIGFVDMADEWNEQTLTNLKTSQKLQALFGLQTTDKNIDRPDIIDGIIICQFRDIHLVIAIFEAILKPSNTLTTDLNQLISAYSSDKLARFIQAEAVAKDSTVLQQPSDVIQSILTQIPKTQNIEFMMLSKVSDRNLSLSEFVGITHAIESRTIVDPTWFYDDSVVEGTTICWIGAIYIAS